MFVRAPPKSKNDDEDSGDEDNSGENKSSEIQDIEDLAGPSNLKNRLPVSHKRKRNEDSPTEKPRAKTWREALGSPPHFGTTKEDRLAWLAFHKRKWAWQKEARAFVEKEEGSKLKCRKTTSNNEIASRPLVTSTLGGFLKKAQHTLLTTPWQIIQIAETNALGVFRVWAMVGTELHQVRLIIPRIFYVNSRIPKEESPDALYRKCNRTLPRACPSLYLYEYTVPEEVYREHNHDLIADLSTPDVEGIYETQMPMLFRALLKLGCICAVEKSEARRLANGLPENNTFMLHHLTFQTVSHQPYLKDEDDLLKTIYLYHHKASTGPRGFFALFLSPIKKALVIVTDSVRTNQMPNMVSLYSTERNNKLAKGKEEAMLPPANITFEVKVETDLKVVYKVIQMALQAYKDEKKGPTILAIQSTIDYQHIVSFMPGLNEFPIVPINVQDIEPVYQNLEWQRFGAKLMVKHYLNSVVALQLQKEQCRYFHVPLGNMPPDPTLFATDLFYARHLSKNNYVLWCSETDRPDLGGREADDNMLLTEFEESSTVINNNPGCYSTVCIELDIDSLAVNTLLQANHISDIDGTANSIAFDSNLPVASFEEVVTGRAPGLAPYSESSAFSGAFRILRHMVAAWLRDVSLYRNEFADFQIVHFYRWLRSSNALLYEPALRRMLHTLMKKLFLQLVAEFKRLGSIIVYANFNKIIICTKKRTVNDAVGYMEFVVTSIRNKELFHGIQMTYNQCWEYLMWLDPSNHGGVKGKLPEGLGGVGEGIENTVTVEMDDSMSVSLAQDEDEGPEIVMNWNICEYLPEVGNVQSMFLSVVAGYIGSVYDFLVKSEPITNTPRRHPTLSSQTQTIPMGVGAHENTVEFAKKLITGDLSQKLFSMVQRISKKFPGESSEDSNVFPKLPGANLRTQNAALEFVKTVCRVLSLDSSVNEEVARLRRNMLRLIDVGEFNDLAEWTDPCTSLVLPEVICRACNHCRDIDLCKDNNRAEEDGMCFWNCPICTTAYDNMEIECLLLDIVNRKTMAYTLQDLQCVRCLEVKMENMTEYCTCAGDFQALVKREELSKCLNTLKSIAVHYEMPILLHTVEWILKMNPTI